MFSQFDPKCVFSKLGLKIINCIYFIAGVAEALCVSESLNSCSASS